MKNADSAVAKKGSVGKVFKVIGNVILWLFVAFAVVVTILVFSAQSNKDGLSNIFGKSLVTIQTPSMSGTFEVGDLIIDDVLTTEEKSQCKVGDVITYYLDIDKTREGREYNTHRIVDLYEEGGYVYYITKGDANGAKDAEPVPYNDVLAKYSGTKIAGVGKVISFLQTSTGFLVVIVIPLVLFFLFELYNFITVIVKIKNKGKVSAEDEEEIKRRAIEEYVKQQQAQSDAASATVTETASAEKNNE